MMADGSDSSNRNPKNSPGNSSPDVSAGVADFGVATFSAATVFVSADLARFAVFDFDAGRPVAVDLGVGAVSDFAVSAASFFSPDPAIPNIFAKKSQ
jgi:hypothetical protein